MRGNLTRRGCSRSQKLNAVKCAARRQEALKERNNFEQGFGTTPRQSRR